MQKSICYALFFFVLSLCWTASAQMADDFSDGNFTENPTWTGDEPLFIVNSSYQLQLNDADAGKASLATEQHLIANTEWRFWIRMSFAPSNNNFAQVYLAADQPDLKEPLNGYFLRFGENGSNDAIELYRQEDSSKKLICRGADGAVAASFRAGVKVTCDANGIWTLSADMSGGTAFQEIASGADTPFFESQYLGLFCQYTKSNATGFYFDDFYAGAIVTDNEPPTLQKVTATTPNTLQLMFSEVITAASSQDLKNYSIVPNNVEPVEAVLQSDGRTVMLTLSSDLVPRTQYLLTAQNISDIAGNVAHDLQASFSWYVPLPNDILINEIMARPSPPVGLPDASYVELFNNTGFNINLNGWSLIIGTSTKNFGDYDLLPQQYLILCHNNNMVSLSDYGDCYGFSSFSLTYGGTSLTLYDPQKNQIAYVRYSDTWYNDNVKKNGGWSLERIDPANGCDWAYNWTASTSNLGGTPGAQNSVFADNPEVMAPELLSANYVDNQSITVFFNKPMNPASISDVSLWNADQGLGQPKSVTPLEPEFSAADIVFNNNIEDGKLYTLMLKADGVTDCSGLQMTKESVISFGKPGESQFHDILATAEANGAINPSGDVIVNHGANTTFFFLPNDRYQVDEVKVDETNVTFTENKYTFTNVTTDHTIHVTFKPTSTLLPFDTYCVTKWNNTFLLNLNKLQADKYIDSTYNYSDIVANYTCAWFKDGKEISEGFFYSVGDNNPNHFEAGAYHFELVYSNTGFALRSTEKVIDSTKSALQVYPNPVPQGSRLVIEGTEPGAPVEVYDITGICVKRATATGNVTELTLTVPAGVYVVRSNGETVRVVIKP